MRLFIAVPLPPAVRTAIADVLRRLKARDWPVRWVRDEGIHVSLKFYGEVTSDRVGAIGEMLDFAARGMAPMVLTPAGAGVFPAGGRPRVIRLDIEAAAELELLQDRIERGSDELGFPPEGRPFRPHVTLGRVREGHRLPDDWQRVLSGVPQGAAFLADRVVLYESQLSPNGPTYTARQEIRLA